MAPRSHPRVIVTDGRETGYSFPAEPGEGAFRAGVALTNQFYDDACLIADAFALACTGPYIGKALGTALPGGWIKIGEDLVLGLFDNLKWVVVGAGIGATFGLGLGLLLPPAEPLTLAGGAALGAAIAEWALVGVGIFTAGHMAFQISAISIDLFGKGVTLALNDNQEGAARCFAQAIALVLGAMIPLAIVCAITKGGGKLIQAQSTKFMLNRLTSKIGATRIVSTSVARTVGLSSVEWQAMCRTSMGIINVFRGCNPARLAAIERAGGMANVHFKPGYLKDFKSAKVGRTGEYVIEETELETYIQGHYHKVQEGTNFKLKAVDGAQKGPYLHNTSPIKGGPWLDEHWLVPTINEGKRCYILKHPDGKTFVPDIDRLFYAEIAETGRIGQSGVLRGHKWAANDDPLEVMYWNQRMARAMREINGEELDWRGFQHGKSADFLVKHEQTGAVGPGWPSRNEAGVFEIENEKIVIAVNGNMFVTDWHGLANFSKSLELLNFKYPWAKAIIREK